MKLKRLSYLVAFAAISLSSGYASTQAAMDVSQDDLEMSLPIRQIMDKYYGGGKFYFGASSVKEYMTEPGGLSQVYFNEFSYNTPENAFKSSTVLSTYGKKNESWRSDEYMYFVQKAREHNQVIRAHGPISPQCSKWAREDNRTPEELDALLQKHMSMLATDMEKNRDVIKWMDVVNECFAGGRQKGLGYMKESTEDDVIYEAYDWFGPRKGNDKWENPWTILGFTKITVDGETFNIPNYVIKAFTIATKNAPHVKLIWNDHGKEIDPKLYHRLELVVKYLRSIGLRVDGIGWQAHVELGWEKKPSNIKNLEDVIDWCYKNKLEFHVTELDVTVKKVKNVKELAYDELERTRTEQAETFAGVVETMLKRVGRGATALNLWTMYDHGHEGSTFAGLFDEQGKPNPSYYKVKALLIQYGRQQNK